MWRGVRRGGNFWSFERGHAPVNRPPSVGTHPVGGWQNPCRIKGLRVVSQLSLDQRVQCAGDQHVMSGQWGLDHVPPVISRGLGVEWDARYVHVTGVCGQVLCCAGTGPEYGEGLLMRRVIHEL